MATLWFQNLHPLLRSLIIIGRMTLLVYIGLLAYLAIFQRRVMYYPSRASAAQLETIAHQSGMRPWLNPDGTIIGWQPAISEPAPHDRILVFHGNAGFALNRTYLVKGFQRPSQNPTFLVYLFEYPGYGARPGSPSQVTFYQAASEALHQIRRESPGSRIFLTGESLGSGIAAWLAGQFPHQVAGLFLMTAFTRMSDVARHHYPYMPVNLLLRDRYDAQAALTAYRGPIAILLAGNDHVVPTKFGQRLYDAYQGPKRLWIQNNRNHNTLDYGLREPWWNEVSDFLIQSAAPSPQPI